jgi:hypothetical protein
MKLKHASTGVSALSTPATSSGFSTKISPGMEQANHSNVHDNFPFAIKEDEVIINTSGDSSRSSERTWEAASAVTVCADRTPAEPSREAHFVQSADGGGTSLEGERNNLAQISNAATTPLETSARSCDCGVEQQNRDTAASAKTPFTVNAADAAQAQRSPEDTQRQLDKAIEDFGCQSKRGFDIVKIAQAMVGLEQMISEVRALSYPALIATLPD